MAQLLEAAAVAEDVSLQGAVSATRPGGELLAALGPAAKTLRALVVTDLDIPDKVRTKAMLCIGPM